ncbi:DUF4232 domain-containing protein [Streptomyces longispororuber]|uniref:DUF4232 domain-containing protein n=1 Tax=Streptomyces longispororuber TaxID=68230 RepID=UPI00210B3DA6|nr:DUF4232 domain-containing protein [Streptomyces longispororuber]MCQ4210589.1 DUF4232 domain-containing protein [Streptomyces longispororuber]
MKHTRIAALAAVGVAATLSLTACGGDGSGKDSSSKGSASSASSPSSSASSESSSSPDDGAKAGGGSGSGNQQASNAKTDSGKGSGAGAAGNNGGAATGGKVTFCKTADLAIDAQDAAPDAEAGRINITMINRGSTTCSATGFPGVDITDADHTTSPIARGHAQPRVTVLKPGDAAVFDLAYTIDSSGNSLATPTEILVTPPNETHTVTLKWPEGAGDIKGAYTDVEVYPTHTTK